jgi:peroxiredoxin
MADWLIVPSIKISAEVTAAEMRFCSAMGITNVINERRKLALKDVAELSGFFIFLP